MCARALVHALNDAKTHAQQGCAMQFSGITLNEVPAIRCLFRAQNGFKLFALFSLESLDSSRSPSPYQPEGATANNSNKLQTWQDHDRRNLRQNGTTFSRWEIPGNSHQNFRIFFLNGKRPLFLLNTISELLSPFEYKFLANEIYEMVILVTFREV